MGYLKFLDSEKNLDASSDILSTTLTSFPSVDANGKEVELFKKKLAYLYEKGQTFE